MKKNVLLIALNIVVSIVAYGQDFHFSQVPLNLHQYNDALTGQYRGNTRFAATYRSQWRSVPVPYTTYQAVVDKKLLESEHGYLGIGIRAAHDDAGDGQLTWTQGGASLSYTLAIGKLQSIAIGFGLNMVQRGVTVGNLKFKNQWNGETYDGSLPSKEYVDADRVKAANISSGLAWAFMPSSNHRTKLSLGFGAGNLNRPILTFSKTDLTPVERRWTGFSHLTLELLPATDVVAFGLYQNQSSYRELQMGAGIRQYLDTSNSSMKSIQLMVSWRKDDAIIPAVQLDWSGWTLGLSYDMNISDFKAATAQRGGPELTLQYRILSVEKLREFKACPIF